MVYYKKTQHSYWLGLIFILIAISIFFASWFKIGGKPLPMTVGIGLIFLFILCYIIFRKLTIVIDDTKIQAKFGLGLITQTLQLKDLNYNSIEKIKVPFIYGIGIRLTPNGTLYNVKFGEAIRMTSHSKTFFVGTEDYEGIKQTLIELKKLQIVK